MIFFFFQLQEVIDILEQKGETFVSKTEAKSVFFVLLKLIRFGSRPPLQIATEHGMAYMEMSSLTDQTSVKNVFDEV